MAKKNNKNDEPELSPEEQKEQEELKKRFEEKEKKKKEKEKVLKKKEKAELKRIKSKVNFPYKLLLLVSLLFTLFAYIVLYFGAELNTMDSLYYTFMVFTATYLGGGIIMMLLFYLVSEEKLIEIENDKVAKEQARKDELKKEEDEFAKLVQAEKDFASRKVQMQEEKRQRLHDEEEIIKEHVLDFEESIAEQENQVIEEEVEKEKELDLSKLPEVKLEGLDLGFTDFNDRDLETMKAQSKTRASLPSVESNEYTLDDLNFELESN